MEPRGEVFIKKCNEAFGFLVSEHGFLGPMIDENGPVVRVRFQKHEIDLECTLDYREDRADVALVRLKSGRRAEGPRIDSEGKRVHMYLGEALRMRGSKSLKEVYKGPTGGETFGELFGKAKLLQAYGGDILQGSASVFEDVDRLGSTYG
jgi:hypothetical protein